MKIDGKTAVVIGGAQGMGAACVVALLDKGAKVCFGDVLVDKGQEMLSEWSTKYGKEKVSFRKCNVSQSDEIEALFKLAKDTMDSVDIFMNCAGIIEELNWEVCLDVNIRGTIHCVTAALAHMGMDRGGKGGVVVLMSSISGLRPEYWAPVYSGSKHFITNYARSWAEPQNFSSHGVRLNCMCPTGINTPFQYSEVLDGGPKKLHPQHVEPMRKACKEVVITGISPEFVAKGFIQLVEDDSLNGKAMRVTEAHGFDFAQYQETPPQ